jgi:hypothetical protein
MESTKNQTQQEGNNAPNRNNNRRGGNKNRGGSSDQQTNQQQTSIKPQSNGVDKEIRGDVNQVIKTASETGFVGPSKEWFDGKWDKMANLLFSFR